MRQSRSGRRTDAAAAWSCIAFLAALALPAAAGAAPPPGSPAYAHGYRHGTVQPRGNSGNAGPGNAGAAGTASTNNLSYGGGISGVGVATAAPHVYLVFWGSQWDSPSSGDPSGMAAYVKSFLSGVGTNSPSTGQPETWSGVMTQYCQGVSAGSTSCSSSAAHVGYPTGGALSGAWVDDTNGAAPSQATALQLANEAVRAEQTQFKDHSSSAQYVIVSPHGTHPDGFNTFSGNFCAWHDYTGDPGLGGTVNSPDGPLAFTNLPYITDMGASCGQDFVNGGSAGALDGVSIVEGHEYAETLTDTFPAGGWTDSTGNENGDKCAWISSGQGASQDVSFATGTFAVQSTWANDYNNGAGGCEVSHPIVTSGTSGGGGGTPNTVTVTNPGNQSSTTTSAVSLQIQASDSGSSTLTYAATGLPPGLQINPSSGLITGTPSAAGSYSVTVRATDTTGASGSTSFTWKVAAPVGNLLLNPGFESGNANWSPSGGVIRSNTGGILPHSGNRYAGLDGYGKTHTDRITQKVTLPSGYSTYTLSFWLDVVSQDTSGMAHDTLSVQILSSSGQLLGTAASYSNATVTGGYQLQSVNLASYAGQTIQVRFLGQENSSLATTFALDDTSLTAS